MSPKLENHVIRGVLCLQSAPHRLPIEEEVTQLAGATISLNFDKMLATARTLGFAPTYRHVATAWNQPA